MARSRAGTPTDNRNYQGRPRSKPNALGYAAQSSHPHPNTVVVRHSDHWFVREWPACEVGEIDLNAVREAILRARGRNGMPAVTVLPITGALLNYASKEWSIFNTH
jgi:hypothetical protein